MTFNQSVITKHIATYKGLFLKQHGHAPTSWFSFFAWLSSFTSAGSFGADDVALAKELL